VTAEADEPADVEAAVADAHRREWGFVLAATVRVAGSVDLAEECVQDAYGAALDTWRRQGVPRSPGAWLTTTARRRALDVLRREQTLRRKLPLLAEPGVTPGADEAMVDQEGEVYRAADLVLAVEIVSPGSRRLDPRVKREEYADAGIPHYWIIDLDEPVSLVACHLAGEFGYVDSGMVAGVFRTTEPFRVEIDLDALL